MRLVGALGTPDVTLTAGAFNDPVNGGGPASVSWQNGYVLGYLVSFERIGHFYQLGCSAGPPLPTRRSTWAGVKGLYR